MTSTLTKTPRHATKDQHGRFDAALMRAAGVIARHHKAIIVFWVVLIAATTPLALKLPDVLTDQGASKVVAGTESGRADALINANFPQRSEREVTVVVTAADVRALPVRRYLAALDAAVQTRIPADIDATSSAYTLFRDGAADYLRQAHATLLTGFTGGTPTPAAWAAGVRAAVAAKKVPAALRQPLIRLGPKQPSGTALLTAAQRVATENDWRAFPVPLPPEAQATFIAPSGTTTIVSTSFNPATGADPDTEWLRRTAHDVAAAQGLGTAVQVNVTGELPLIGDTYDKADADNGLMETVAYIVIAVVLLLFFRSVVATALTVAMVGLSMNVSQAALWALGHEVTLTQFTVTIMTFVMLGAGVDYSMLLSSRYRQQRVAGQSVPDAVIRATASAGESVLLAATAVILAFGVALLSPVNWVPPLGYGGLVGIPIIFVAVLTLTPAMLMLLGDKFFLLGLRPMTDMENTGALSRNLRRLSGFANRRRVVVTALFLVASMPFAYLVSTTSFSADPAALSADTDSKRGFDAVAREWGKNAAFPTVIVGPADPAVAAGAKLSPAGYQRVVDLGRGVAAVPGVIGVTSLTQPFGTPVTQAEAQALPAGLRRDYLSDAGVLRMVVTLRDDPFSANAHETVERIKSVVHSGGTSVGDLAVGGPTHVDAEYSAALTRSFWQLVLLVSVLISAVLVIALRSLVIPLQLIATIMISNLWAIGVTILVFHHLRHEVVINDLPVFLIILMMGLGMDYEIFLVTRIRELMRGGMQQERAIGEAVVDTGRVIGAAGLVMTGSLGAMILSSTLMLREYGVGLGVAVLLDATLIRMLLVPAVLILLRRWNWWLPFRRRSPAPAPSAG
jgi:RND superfamily putative drug exporter